MIWISLILSLRNHSNIKGYEIFTNLNYDQVVYTLLIPECLLKILGYDMQDLTFSHEHMLVFVCALIVEFSFPKGTCHVFVFRNIAFLSRSRWSNNFWKWNMSQ